MMTEKITVDQNLSPKFKRNDQWGLGWYYINSGLIIPDVLDTKHLILNLFPILEKELKR